MKRHGDRSAQALRDLRQAKISLGAGLFEYLGGEGGGHTISKLLKELSEEYRPPDVLLRAAADLDKLYIPTRYPNGFEQGYPGEFFHEENAREALEKARQIVHYVQEKIEGGISPGG